MMALQCCILLFGILSQVVANPFDHVYPPNCIYPIGFLDNTSVSTIDYVGLKPIERCCPGCAPCAHLGGFCVLRWVYDIYPLWCEFSPIWPCRDYSCKCCINCGNDKCSACIETGGNCRKTCRAGEHEDKKNLCAYNDENSYDGEGCKCCKKCEPQPECYEEYGYCVTHPDQCEHGQFASHGCCGGCYCCKPVLEPVPGTKCADYGGYCSETEECSSGYYGCFGECTKTVYYNGLKSIVAGYCCIPK